jgi:hypothetical protein
MILTIKLEDDSKIELCPAGGPWFNGKTYFGPDECGWRLFSKAGALLGSGFCPTRDEAMREATNLDCKSLA